MPKTLVVAALVAVALSLSCRSPAVQSARSALSMPSVVVTDFGASPDAADNRAAFQAAIDAAPGGVVHVPAGTWRVGRAGSAYWCLRLLAASTALVGDGAGATVIQQTEVGASVSLLEVDGDGASVQDVTLDGARDLQKIVSEHRHGVFVRGRHFTASRSVFTRFTGDGVYGYGGADDLALVAVECSGNARNGFTMGGAIRGVTATSSTFVSNEAQQIDSEPGSPGHVDDVTIRDSLVDARGASNDYALTVCGSLGGQSRGWTIDRTVVNGGVYVVWASDVTVTRLSGINPTTKPSLSVYRRSSGVVVDRSHLTATVASPIVSILGTGLGQAPSDVSILHTTVSGGGAIGVMVQGATSAELAEVTVESTSASGAVAVGARPTSLLYDLDWLVTRGVVASGWARGFSVAGYGDAASGFAHMGLVVAVRDSLGAPSYLDDGTGALQAAAVSGLDVARWPVGAVVETGPVETTMRRP